jgi:hypothetical protein
LVDGVQCREPGLPEGVPPRVGRLETRPDQ